METRFIQVAEFQRKVEDREMVRDALADERSRAMEKWMKHIDESLNERKKNDQWMLRIVGGGVIAVIINFMLSGGLTLGN